MIRNRIQVGSYHTFSRQQPSGGEIIFGMASRFSSRLRQLHRRTAVFSLISAPSFNCSQRSIICINPQPYPFSFRLLSTRPIRSTRADIGARARQLQARRLWTYALTFSCIAGFIVIVMYQFQDQLVFYVTPSEALEKYNSDPAKSKFRLGGLVLENSVTEIPASPEIQFVVTDLLTDILVKYEGSLPDLFREGHSVVVEGFVRPVDEESRKKEETSLSSHKLVVSEKARSLGCFFAATEVLAKHDEKYMPAEVAAALEKNNKLVEEEEKKKKKEGALVAASADSKAAQ